MLDIHIRCSNQKRTEKEKKNKNKNFKIIPDIVQNKATMILHFFLTEGAFRFC